MTRTRGTLGGARTLRGTRDALIVQTPRGTFAALGIVAARIGARAALVTAAALAGACTAGPREPAAGAATRGVTASAPPAATTPETSPKTRAADDPSPKAADTNQAAGDPAATRGSGDSRSDPPPALPPRLATLTVPGFSNAIVSFPEQPRPVEPLLVAVHGAGDGPQWECATWRALLGERGVILCPAGKPLGKSPEDGFYHPDHHALGALLTASLDALRAAWGARVDTRRAVYAAYSQGATMGSHVVVDRAGELSRLVLVEGGFDEWNVPRGIAFRDGGGSHVLFACGTRHCAERARRSAAWLERAGLAVRVETAPGAGHTYGGDVAHKVHGALGWLLTGDDRW